MTTTVKPNNRYRQGFAALSPEERTRIARLGGKAAWATGKAHRWDAESAAEAGRKGGSISRRRGKKSQTEQ
jgi:general stress protein YciG